LTVPTNRGRVKVYAGTDGVPTVEIGGGLPGTPGDDGADGVSVTGASINGSGHLILTLSSGGPIDAGVAKGADGTDGTDGTDGRSVTGASIDGSGHLILTFSSAPSPVDLGDVTGADGADGRSITGASIDGSGHLILTFSSAPSPVDLGDVTGADGTDGTDGTDGVSIVDAEIDGSYHLILTLSDASTIDAGYVRGPAGTGDVTGPGSAVSGNFASYADTTGSLLGGQRVGPSAFATAAQGTKADSALQSISETGNGISINVSVPTAPVLSLDATLEAVANFATAADVAMYWTGTDTLGSYTTTLTRVLSWVRRMRRRRELRWFSVLPPRSIPARLPVTFLSWMDQVCLIRRFCRRWRFRTCLWLPAKRQCWH
jgi:hypothetical protein